MKIVLSIAGSDSSGGAGIQADIKSGFYHKVFMTTAITAVTVQNTLGVTDVVVLKPEFVVKQIKSVIEDFKVNCIKIGMLSSKELIFEVFRVPLQWLRGHFLPQNDFSTLLCLQF